MINPQTGKTVENLNKALESIFSNTNDWLRYADTKAATLIAGNGGLIFGGTRVLSSEGLNIYFLIYVSLIITLCGISLVVCLISVTPALSMPWEAKPTSPSDNDNLLFFSDIAKYTPLAYLQALNNKLELQTNHFNGYQRDLSSQIITNSTISNKKYKLFKTAIWLTLAAIVTPIIIVFVYLIRKKS